MNDVRSLLYEADALRSRAAELEKFAELAEPAVGLGVGCGTFRIHNHANVAVLIAAAKTAAAALLQDARAIEARVQIVASA